MLALTFPHKTRAHDIPAGWKLLALAVISALLFSVQNIVILVVMLALVICLHAALGKGLLRYALWMMRPIVLFTAIILVFHVITNDLLSGLSIVLRMLVLVALANLATMTTKLDDMIGVIEWLLIPLGKLGVNTRIFGVATAMVIRFTPILIKKATALGESWRARSSKRAGWRIIMPLFLTAIDDAEHVAEALKARGGV